jgi:hypothetical protein
MKKDILDVINYFNHFKYPASLDELLLFLANKASRSELLVHLHELEKGKNIVGSDHRYALGGYSKIFAIWADRKAISEIRINRIEWFVKLLSKFPQIILFGISGGLSMLNSDSKDDIDIFIITQENRIWTGRMIALLLSSLFGIRRSFRDKNVKDKLCFNLFFDESCLEIPDFKKNRYIAHEIVQMKPLVIKNNSYSSFLEKNRWVSSFFPNLSIEKLTMTHKSFLVQPPTKIKSKRGPLGDYFENFLRFIQLIMINRHRTNEIVSEGQLWFFPRDFQKKIKKLI